MSWADIGANDWVTNNNAQDAVNNGLFSLKSGQSIPANNNFMTISEANAKLNITAVGGTGTTWIKKNQFGGAITVVQINGVNELTSYSGYGSSSDNGFACTVLNNPGDFQEYIYDIWLGTTDSDGIVRVGSRIYYALNNPQPFNPINRNDYNVIGFIDNNGIHRWMKFDPTSNEVIAVGNCSTPKVRINDSAAVYNGSYWRYGDIVLMGDGSVDYCLHIMGEDIGTRTPLWSDSTTADVVPGCRIFWDNGLRPFDGATRTGNYIYYINNRGTPRWMTLFADENIVEDCGDC